MNSVSIVGRMAGNPELKTTPSGVAVTSFSVAVQRAHAAKDGKRETDFLDVVAWRNTAEFICKYFTKGQFIAVNGTIQTKNWKDQNGNNRKAVEILAEKVSFCGGNSSSTESRINAEATPAAPTAPELPADWAVIGQEEDLPF